MNKTIMFTTLAFICTFAFAAVAQDAPAPKAAPSVSAPLKLTAGTMTFGGSIYYGSDSYTIDYDGNESDMDQSIIKLSPSFGYFLQDNLELAIKLSYTSQTTEFEGGSESENNTTGLALGANYYLPLHEKLVLSVGGAVILQMDDDGEDYEMTQYGVAVNCSALYPLLPSLALEAGVNINYTLGTTDNGAGEGDISGFGFQIGYFGIRAFF
jgi:hypothetical protein